MVSSVLAETLVSNDTGFMVRYLGLVLLLLGTPSLPYLAGQTDAGTAGVFSDVLGGRVTASGEVYDPEALTAGSPNLRFGLRLAVTNPANGRVVTVRVNDRGPSPEGRILNLSRAAAGALGLSPGDPVEIRALRFDEPEVSTPASAPPAVASPAVAPPTEPPPPPILFVPTPPPSTFIQMGAFRTEANAQRLAASLSRQGFDPRIRRLGVMIRVYLVVAEAEAPALVDRLTALGRRGFLQISKEPGGNPIKLPTD